MTSEPCMHKRKNLCHTPVISIIIYCKKEVSIVLKFSAMFNTAVYCLKSTFAINVATMNIMDNFRYERKPSYATTKSTLFAISKDEWDIADKNLLYIFGYAKRHLRPKRHLTAKIVKPLAIVLVWRHQLVSQSLENMKFTKFLVKAF